MQALFLIRLNKNKKKVKKISDMSENVSDIFVGREGFEPPYSEESGFTVHRL